VEFFSPSGSPTILVSPYEILRQNSTGIPLNGVVLYKKLRLPTKILLFDFHIKPGVVNPV